MLERWPGLNECIEVVEVVRSRRRLRARPRACRRLQAGAKAARAPCWCSERLPPPGPGLQEAIERNRALYGEQPRRTIGEEAWHLCSTRPTHSMAALLGRVLGMRAGEGSTVSLAPTDVRACVRESRRVGHHTCGRV